MTNTSFNIYYDLAKKYYEKYGNLRVPRKFKTIDGISFDEKGYALGMWVSNQRHYYKTHNEDYNIKRKTMLDNIGMIWDLHEYNFDFMYLLACRYFEFYGDLEIPYRFKTKDGINYCEDGYALGCWIATQRNAYNYDEEYSMDKYNKLNDKAMNWSIQTR